MIVITALILNANMIVVLYVMTAMSIGNVVGVKQKRSGLKMTDKRKSNAIGTDKVLRGIEYRPTDEVRKETAKDILLQLAQFRAVSPAFSATWDWLAEKYGVEIKC